MKKNSKEKYSVVSMQGLGIDALVLTPQANIDKWFNKFESEPDLIWANGKGKKFLHKSLHETLKHEDFVFTVNPSIADTNPKRWSKFMDDCVVFAVLNSVVKDEPMLLLHPSSYTNRDPEFKFAIDKSEGVIPTLFESIPCLQ